MYSGIHTHPFPPAMIDLSSTVLCYLKNADKRFKSHVGWSTLFELLLMCLCRHTYVHACIHMYVRAYM